MTDVNDVYRNTEWHYFMRAISSRGWMFECPRCGALLLGDSRDLHTKFHDMIDSVVDEVVENSHGAVYIPPATRELSPLERGIRKLFRLDK